MNIDELKNQWGELVVEGKPTEKFWTLWRVSKDELKALGVRVSKGETGYIAELGEPFSPNEKGKKLLTLKNIPTLGEFIGMTPAKKMSWIKKHPDECKVMGLEIERKFPVLRGISEIGIRRMEEYTTWSRKIAHIFSISVRDLRDWSIVFPNGSQGDEAKAIFEKWKKIPLNELKHYIVNKSAKSIAEYFSPDAVARREEIALHNHMMQDTNYAFEYTRSIYRGEKEMAVTENDKKLAEQNDEYFARMENGEPQPCMRKKSVRKNSAKR